MAGKVFQIATGVETSIVQLVSLVQTVVGRGVSIQHGPQRQGDPRKNYSGIRKAREARGWQPQVDLMMGLKETWESFRLTLAGKAESIA